MADVIKRHQYADYLNIGTTASPDWKFMGTGFVTLDENPNAQTDSVKYVCDKSATSSVIGYESQFPFQADQIMEEAAIDDIYSIARNRCVGSDAEREYCRVELWNRATGANQFEARKFVVSVEVSSLSGENKQSLSGNLNCVGDPVMGTFNTSTKTFTPAA